MSTLGGVINSFGSFLHRWTSLLTICWKSHWSAILLNSLYNGVSSLKSQWTVIFLYSVFMMYWQRTIFAGMKVGFLIQEKKVPVTVSSQSMFLITNHTFIAADLFKTITSLLFACITFCDMLEIWLSAVHEQSCFNSHTNMTWRFFRPSSKSGVLTMLLWASQNLFALVLKEFGVAFNKCL